MRVDSLSAKSMEKGNIVIVGLFSQHPWHMVYWSDVASYVSHMYPSVLREEGLPVSSVTLFPAFSEVQ
jgi:hypothetical protein